MRHCVVVIDHLTGEKKRTFLEYITHLPENSFECSDGNVTRGRKSHPYQSPKGGRVYATSGLALRSPRSPWVLANSAVPLSTRLSQARPWVLQRPGRRCGKSRDLLPTSQVTHCPLPFCRVHQESANHSPDPARCLFLYSL